jgi:hypothetical protein
LVQFALWRDLRSWFRHFRRLADFWFGCFCRVPADGQIVETGDERECFGAEKLKLLFNPDGQPTAF